jgi:hypothetical protein
MINIQRDGAFHLKKIEIFVPQIANRIRYAAKPQRSAIPLNV